MTFRNLVRAAAAVALTAGISFPLAHGVAHAVIDDSDADAPTATTGFLGDLNLQDTIANFIPTDENAADCPDGTFHLLFQGRPVVGSDGAPVCVTEDSQGVSVPGEPGQPGQDGNVEGDVAPGGAGTPGNL